MPEPEAKEKPAAGTASEAGQQEEGGGGEKVEPSESKRGPPEGVVPLFFSGPSQQIFGCVVDVDLTEENPHKLIPKEKILEDFKNRAAVSDFSPLKQKILSYPGEDILLVYDYDFKYGENFYVCITEEAKELVLNPPPEEVGEEGEGEGGGEELYEIPKTPQPKEWVCLGSDLEIMESKVTTSRPLVQFTVSRRRQQFNRPVALSDGTGLESVEIVSQPEPEGEAPLIRLELEAGVQAVEDTREAACQTERRVPCNAVVQYEPRTLSDSETAALMEGDEMTAFLQEVYPRLEISLQQNLIMDLFVDDCRALSDEDWMTGSNSGTHLKEYQSFTDLKFSKDKVINWIEWHPVIKGVIAVACGEGYSADERIDLSTRLTTSRALILLWSFTDPIHPQLFLEAPEDILCFRFNPSDPNIIAGGCVNGQVVLWDLREYVDRLQINKTSEAEERSRTDNMDIFITDVKLDHAPVVSPCVLSSLEHSHSLSVSHLHWIPDHNEICLKSTHVLENTSQFSHQLVTCGIDGYVMMWDTRPQQSGKKSTSPQKKNTPHSLTDLDLTWKPFYKIPLPRSELPKSFSATRVSLREKQRGGSRGKQQGARGEGDSENQLVEKKSSQIHPIVSQTNIGTGAEIEGASTKYFVGTEDSEIVWGDWTPTKDQESGKFIPPRPDYFSYGHCGSVACMERSPFFRDILLTAGGWTWTIWREGEKSGPLLSSSSCEVQYTGGAWSPSRPGVFFLSQQNGGLEVWDLMDRSHEPTLSQNISSLPITSISPFRITSKQEMLGVGDSAGTLHILDVPWALKNPSTNEEGIMEGFFERETQRVVFSSGRAAARAATKKESMTAASAELTKEESAGAMELESVWQEEARRVYDDYLATENKLLIELGVVEPPPTQDDD